MCQLSHTFFSQLSIGKGHAAFHREFLGSPKSWTVKQNGLDATRETVRGRLGVDKLLARPKCRSNDQSISSYAGCLDSISPTSSISFIDARVQSRAAHRVKIP